MYVFAVHLVHFFALVKLALYGVGLGGLAGGLGFVVFLVALGKSAAVHPNKIKLAVQAAHAVAQGHLRRFILCGLEQKAVEVRLAEKGGAIRCGQGVDFQLHVRTLIRLEHALHAVVAVQLFRREFVGDFGFDRAGHLYGGACGVALGVVLGNLGHIYIAEATIAVAHRGFGFAHSWLLSS